MTNLSARARVGLAVLAVIMGALSFIPAMTIDYWQAWVYLGIFVGTSALITAYLIKNDPALLRRRLKGGPTAEKEKAQKIVMLITSISFIALLVVPALDHRLK